MSTAVVLVKAKMWGAVGRKKTGKNCAFPSGLKCITHLPDWAVFGPAYDPLGHDVSIVTLLEPAVPGGGHPVEVGARGVGPALPLPIGISFTKN